MMKQGRFFGLTAVLLFSISACQVPTNIPSPNEPPGGGTTNPTPTPVPTSTPVPNPTSTPVPTPTPISTSLLGAQLGIPDTVDLRQFDGPVVDQFGGTCTAFATAAAMNNTLKRKGIQKLVSERHLWSTYQAYDMDYAVQAARSNFLTEEKYWPVNGTRSSNYMSYASLRISESRNLDYDFHAGLQALGRGNAVIMAIQVPRDLGNCAENIGPNSTYTSGQHVIEAVGYKLDDKVAGGGYFIIKNSWGTDCGNRGYHNYPFKLCERSDLYCYFTEVIDVEDRS